MHSNHISPGRAELVGWQPPWATSKRKNGACERERESDREREMQIIRERSTEAQQNAIDHHLVSRNMVFGTFWAFETQLLRLKHSLVFKH